MKFNEQMRPLAKSGAKTQTRRLMKPQPVYHHGDGTPGGDDCYGFDWKDEYYPYDETDKQARYQPGDTFTDDGVEYEVLKVWAELVRDISHEDAEKEGLEQWAWNKSFELRDQRLSMAQLAFSYAIDEFYPGSWERNDWIWCYEFKRVNGCKPIEEAE